MSTTVLHAVLMYVTVLLNLKCEHHEKKFKVSQIRDLLNQVYNEKITFSRFVEILNEQAETKDIKDLISTIKVDKANLEHIAQTGKNKRKSFN